MSIRCQLLNKILLTSAFEKMGPDRLKRAVTARTAKDWHRCFIAVAYPEFDLQQRISRSEDPRHERTVAEATGLTEEEVLELVTAHDHCNKCRAYLLTLASEWLETNREAKHEKPRHISDPYVSDVRVWFAVEKVQPFTFV